MIERGKAKRRWSEKDWPIRQVNNACIDYVDLSMNNVTNVT